MKPFISIISLIILTFIQVAFLPNFEIFFTIPNLILVVAVAWCLAGGFKEAIIWAVLGGIILDLYSPFYFGIIALSNLAVIALIYFITQSFTNNNDKFTIAGVGAIATVAYNVIIFILIYIFKLVRLSDIIQPLSWQFALSIIVQVVMNTIILLLIFNFVKSIHSLETYYEQRRQIKA